jgi:hypothetical protein
MKFQVCSMTLRLTLFAILCGLLLGGTPHLLWAYGGGGGGGGGGGDGEAGSSGALQPLTAQQIENIFGHIGNTPGLSSQAVETMVKTFKGKTVDPKILYRIRQQMLEVEQRSANFWSSVWGGAVVLAETADTVGSYSQFVLTFVPGVGWATNAALSVARSGAETYRDGGDAGQIAQAMTVNGVTSVIMKGSPLGNKGGNALSRASRALGASKTAVSQTVKTALIKRGQKHLIKGVTYTYIDSKVSGQVEGLLNKGATAVKNNLPSPTHRSSSSPGWGPTAAR